MASILDQDFGSSESEGEDFNPVNHESDDDIRPPKRRNRSPNSDDVKPKSLSSEANGKVDADAVSDDADADDDDDKLDDEDEDADEKVGRAEDDDEDDDDEDDDDDDDDVRNMEGLIDTESLMISG